MNTYYLSLVGPFYGLYLKVKAESSENVRNWAAKHLGSKIWCSVYPEKELTKEVYQGLMAIENVQVVGKVVRLEKNGTDIAYDYI